MEGGREGGRDEGRRERTKAHRLELTCISISISCLKSSSRFAPVVYRMTHSCKAARSSSILPRSETRGIKGAGARERESLRAQRRGRAQESETTRQESETTRTLLHLIHQFSIAAGNCKHNRAVNFRSSLIVASARRTEPGTPQSSRRTAIMMATSLRA